MDFKDTNKIQQAGEGSASPYVYAAPPFSQEPNTSLGEAGPVINKREKVAASLDPN